MRFLFITNSPDIARFVTARGVDRIMVDLELKGKEARQGHLSTVISRHTLADVAAVRAATPPGALLVRINPIDDDTPTEVDLVIAAGADLIMLPMFRSLADAAALVRIVNRQAKIVLLAETAAAIAVIGDVAALDGIDEIHIGLNDLSLDLGQRFMFQPLANGQIDAAAAAIRATGTPFGIGGIARAEEGLLPAQLIVGEHVRLGSTAAILSRTFHRNATTVAEIEADTDFAGEVAKLRAVYAATALATADELAAIHYEVGVRVAQIVGALKTP